MQRRRPIGLSQKPKNPLKQGIIIECINAGLSYDEIMHRGNQQQVHISKPEINRIRKALGLGRLKTGPKTDPVKIELGLYLLAKPYTPRVIDAMGRKAGVLLNSSFTTILNQRRKVRDKKWKEENPEMIGVGSKGVAEIIEREAQKIRTMIKKAKRKLKPNAEALEALGRLFPKGRVKIWGRPYVLPAKVLEFVKAEAPETIAKITGVRLEAAIDMKQEVLGTGGLSLGTIRSLIKERYLGKTSRILPKFEFD